MVSGGGGDGVSVVRLGSGEGGAEESAVAVSGGMLTRDETTSEFEGSGNGTVGVAVEVSDDGGGTGEGDTSTAVDTSEDEGSISGGGVVVKEGNADVGAMTSVVSVFVEAGSVGCKIVVVRDGESVEGLRVSKVDASGAETDSGGRDGSEG